MARTGVTGSPSMWSRFPILSLTMPRMLWPPRTPETPTSSYPSGEECTCMRQKWKRARHSEPLFFSLQIFAERECGMGMGNAVLSAYSTLKFRLACAISPASPLCADIFITLNIKQTASSLRQFNVTGAVPASFLTPAP